MSYGPSFPAAPSEPPPSSGHGLHPMTIGRVFDLSLRMLRFRWRALIGAAAMLLIPVYVIDAITRILTAPVINAWFQSWEQWLLDLEFQQIEPTFGEAAFPPMPPFPPGLWEAIALSIALGIIAIFVTYLAVAAVVHAAGRIYDGGDPSARESVRQALRRAPSLIGAQLLIYVAILAVIVVGAVAGALMIGQGAGPIAFAGVILIVTAIVLMFLMLIRWVFVQQAIMLEGSGAVDGLGRSWRLVGGSALRVLGYIIVVALTVGLIAAVIVAVGTAVLTGGTPAADTPTILLEALLSGAVTIVVTPFTTILFTLLYYDIRWRKEALASGTPANGAGQPPYDGRPPFGGQPPGG